MTSRKPHPHADLIHAWADGAEIEVFYRGGWEHSSAPLWAEDKIYRIKPNTITVPEHEVPEPVWEPVSGKTYYRADASYTVGVVSTTFDRQSIYQLRMAERGLLYPCTDEGKAHAKQRAKAMWLTKPEKSKMPKRTVWLEVDIQAATDNAILVIYDDQKAWIPLSQIVDTTEDIETHDHMEIEISEWLATEKGLV